jgi:hypothetical protein
VAVPLRFCLVDKVCDLAKTKKKRIVETSKLKFYGHFVHLPFEIEAALGGFREERDK